MDNMEKIPSFTVDHLRLQRGVYVSRKDTVGNGVLTTFDVRMKQPNREPALGQAATHTMEHLGATFLRNHPEWKSQIIYWGPMGCFTGFYFIVKGDREPADVLPLLQETYAYMATYEGELPGATPRDCGNYLMQNLPMARYESSKFLHEVLEHMTPDRMEYPK